MNPLLYASPVFVVFFKWTGVLALGWAAHGLLRRRHARWRVILWRSILCFGLVLPLLHWVEVPGIKIPVSSEMVSDTEIAFTPPVEANALASRHSGTVASPVQSQATGGQISSGLVPERAASKPISWRAMFAGVWAAGFFYGAVRLMRLQRQLARLRREAAQPPPELLKLAVEIQARLDLRREIEIRISDAVTSPFVCGIVKPAILLPGVLAEQLSPSELHALLSHELAHLRQHDLLWCVAWRWMKAVCWFHPLVWQVPAVHNLACEQEADRIASRQLADEDSYVQLLARLALRVMALPAVETSLTVNGSSQIARRLHHLGQKGIQAWNWRYSVAAFGLVALIFFAVAGCGFKQSSTETQPTGDVVETGYGALSPAADIKMPVHENDIPLSEAIRSANELIKLTEPLTEQEVVAAVGNIKYEYPDIESVTYDAYKRVVDEEVLPKGMFFKQIRSYTTTNGQFRVDWIDLCYEGRTPTKAERIELEKQQQAMLSKLPPNLKITFNETEMRVGGFSYRLRSRFITGHDTIGEIKYSKVLVVVQDEAGKPVEGAEVFPTGFRVKGIHSPDAYPWNKKLFGPAQPVVTDHDGKAYLKYPVTGIPEEKELTGALGLTVSHPEFATTHIQTYFVDQPEQPIQMTHGIHLTVSGYFGNEHQPVTNLVPTLNEWIIDTNDWQRGENGVYAFHKMSPGGHLVGLMGRLSSGEIVFSEAFPFTAERGKEYSFDLEMKPGIRLEGRIDNKVPRPVKNGRVLISVRPKEFPAWHNEEDVDAAFKKYPNIHFWNSYRPIADDGTFVFESIPPGEVDVTALGDGFVSQNGGDYQIRSNSVLVTNRGIVVPQPFALVAPTTKIEVVTEPSAALEFTARTKEGKPVEGATVYVYPNVLRVGGIFGYPRQSSEEPFRSIAPLPYLYSAVTGTNGVATIPNVPAITRSMGVQHPQFQAPLREGIRDRYINTTFAPGATNHFELILEPKGADFIGKN